MGDITYVQVTKPNMYNISQCYDKKKELLNSILITKMLVTESGKRICERNTEKVK